MPSVIAAGTTAGSAISVTGDTTGNLAFQTNGTTTAMTIDTSQNVGIGTTSPATKTEIYGTAAASNLALRITNTATNGYSTLQMGDANAGLYRNGSAQSAYAGANSLNLVTVGAHNIGFSTQNALRATIDSSGNVGIGTNAPSSLLHVRQATATGASLAGTNQLILENNGAVGIGLVTPTANQAIIRHGTPLDQDSCAIKFDGTSRYMSFSTVNGIERMRINNGGNVGIGVTDPTNVRLYIKGEAASSSNWAIYALNSNNVQMFGIRNDNYFFAPSIGNYATGGTAVYYDGGGYVGINTSSLRYKKDIRDYDKGLDAIAALRPVYYKAKNTRADGTVDDNQYAGLIAEEVDAAGLNEFVVYDEEGRPNAVQYQNMIALMTKAIQELKAELDVAKAEIQALKGVA